MDGGEEHDQRLRVLEAGERVGLAVDAGQREVGRGRADGQGRRMVGGRGRRAGPERHGRERSGSGAQGNQTQADPEHTGRPFGRIEVVCPPSYTTERPMDRGEIAIRPIVAADAVTVAEHATSWRGAYRGMLRDEYLDADAPRNAGRSGRVALGDPSTRSSATSRRPREVRSVSCSCAAAPTRVGHAGRQPARAARAQGTGIGRRLLEAAALETARRYPGERVHLFVFEANAAARRFYASIGGPKSSG